MKSAPPIQTQVKSNVQHVEGTIKGYEMKEFTFYAQEGQMLKISMATHIPAAYFNVFAPNSDDVMFNSSTNADQFEGIVQKTGEYKISVYQMRASARRNKIAQYRLEIKTK